MSDREADIGWCADPEPALEFGAQDDPRPAHDGEFERVYRDHYAFVWRCARRMGVAAGDLDDVLQDTFVAAYRRFDSWDRRVRATTWLFGILRNVMRNRVRGLRRHQRRIDALTRHGAAPVESGERMLAGELLRDFVAKLDDDKRAVFVLAELEGMTGSEIAEVLAINPNTASSRLRAARQAFAEHFDQRDTRRRVERAARRAREQPEQPPQGGAERTLALVMVGPAPLFGSGGAFATGLGKLGLFPWFPWSPWFMAASVAVVASVAIPRLGASEREPAGESVHVAAIDHQTRSRGSSDPITAAAASVSGFDEEPITVIAESLARARPATKVAHPGRDLPDLAGYEALRAAREHLIGQRPEAALALLDASDASEGPLGEARAATRIAALCQLDRHAEAEALWSGLEPSSPVVERLRDACWSTH